MKMNAASIKNQKAEWEALGVKLPAFDHDAMTAKTKEHPVWVHFGAGNIFRGFIAALQQRLLNEGLQDRDVYKRQVWWRTYGTVHDSFRLLPQQTYIPDRGALRCFQSWR